MKVTNKTNKIIGFGTVSILPGETGVIPQEYERNPILEFYRKNNFVSVKGEPTEPEKTAEELAAEQAAAEAKAAAEAEEIRQQRLASLDNISEADLAQLAEEFGINPADCKDQADILKKVKAALKK